MKTLSLILTLLCVVSNSSASNYEIETLRDMYTDAGIKVPEVNHFTNSYSSQYFSSHEIGNKDNTSFVWYLANGAFWWSMDNIREVAGRMVISSSYRNPLHNKDAGGEEDSVHQYGGATDVKKIGENYWVDMTREQKDRFLEHVHAAQIALQAEYGDGYFLKVIEETKYVHIQLMDYCGFDENYS